MRPEPSDAGSEPGPPPLPPADLHSRTLPIHVHDVDRRLYRIHPTNRYALFFGPAKGQPPHGRWDVPDGRYSVCYLAEQPFAAFAETFLREPGVMVLEAEDLAARSLAIVHILAPLRLVALHGQGLHALGATAASCTGDYAVSRAWSAALHAHPETPDGIRYRARHDDDGFAIALFDRAQNSVADMDGAPLTDPANHVRLAECLNRYGIGLLG